MSLTINQIAAIKEVKTFIDSVPQLRISIGELCKLSQLSMTKLSKGFIEMYGITIYHYQVRMAMEYGQTLLRKGISVKAVSIELGYRTPGNFTRTFIKIYGIAPAKIKYEKMPQ